MPKRIVLLSDGTGNAAAAVWRTNVWRVFQSVDLTQADQVAIYADGVGTSAFKPLALLGGAFGWGLKRNVLDLYKFLCQNYQDGDDIFAFGFSRGAFTIRVAMGLVLNQGLVTYSSESDLDRRAAAAYRAYRKERYVSKFNLAQPLRALRDLFYPDPPKKAENVQVSDIRFLGLWDTVAAYGFPVEEMTRGISAWLWPLELPDRNLSSRVKRACHAVALDDERTTFHPVLWNERDEAPVKPASDGKRYTKDERVSQVWFVGAHSNVGGGYPDDALAHIPLCWIMEEAKHCGLRYKSAPFPDALLLAQSMRDKDGRQYDPRKGLGGYYRYGPRKLADLCHTRFSKAPNDEVEIATPKIHESVFHRIASGARTYAPVGIPEHYEVVTTGGQIVPPFEPSQQAVARARLQEKAWNFVWLRRVLYFTTVAATIYLLADPLVAVSGTAERETTLRPISDGIRIVAEFLPGAAKYWASGYASDPGKFGIWAAVLIALMVAGLSAGSRILDGMRTIWKRPGHAAFVGTFPHGPVQSLRTHTWYRAIHWALKRHIAPFFLVVAIVVLSATAISHVAFNFLDAGGWICTDGPTTGLARGEKVTKRFDVKSLCFSSGVHLEEAGRYRITIKANDLVLPNGTKDSMSPWRDWNIKTSPRGFYTADLSFWQQIPMRAGVLLRRALFRPWFRVIARIGSKGSEEEFLDPPKDGSLQLQEIIRPKRSGELFLYVNDAVVSLPWLTDLFYRCNEGTAEVTIERQ